jgi:hypothetical protein
VRFTILLVIIGVLILGIPDSEWVSIVAVIYSAVAMVTVIYYLKKGGLQ